MRMLEGRHLIDVRTPRRIQLSARAGWALAQALGGGALAVGAILPWTSVSLDGYTISHSGVDLGLGLLTGIVGLAWVVIGAVSPLVLRHSRVLASLAIACGLFAAVAAIEALVVGGVAPDGQFDAAVGLEFTIVGSSTLIAASVGNAWSGSRSRMAEAQSARTDGADAGG
jgi:hypothetical protein